MPEDIAIPPATAAVTVAPAISRRPTRDIRPIPAPIPHSIGERRSYGRPVPIRRYGPVTSAGKIDVRA
ncbi:hypothetical protein Q0Z83_090080 [Actinoplanes sichuanensis]|nr:hypothetical protein Q0Z83_090080 [Actinoplanes sichuanensis]